MDLCLKQEGSEVLVKTLVGFGAMLNVLNANKETALDLALQQNKPRIAGLLQSCGGINGDVLRTLNKKPRLKLFGESVQIVSVMPMGRLSGDIRRPISPGLKSVTQRCGSVSLQDVQDGLTLVSLPDRLKQCINFKLDQSG